MAIVNVRCPESGKLRFADWEPIPEEDYPGAAVCVCTYGVAFLKGSYSKKTGVGKMKVHTIPTCTVCDAPEFSTTHDFHLEEEEKNR